MCVCACVCACVCVCVTAARCWILGGFGAAAPVNITTPPHGGPGSVTVAKALNSGQKYGVFIQSAEEFTITNNYIGGQRYSLFLSVSLFCLSLSLFSLSLSLS